MAYRLMDDDKTIERNVSLTEGALGCYDTLGDENFDYDRDELLHERSRLEFVRDQLSTDQQAELMKVDAHWREHAKAFNQDFATLHARADLETAMTGFVQDDQGRTPAIPNDHWWWWPIEEV